MNKKIICSALLGLGLLSSANAAQESGIFVGANVGVPVTSPSYGGGFHSTNMNITIPGYPISMPASLSRSLKSILPTSGVGWGLGLDFGYKQALTESMGFKYYISLMYAYSYGSSNKKADMSVDESMAGYLALAGITDLTATIGNVQANMEQYLVTFNIDYYYNVTDLFGMYIGLGFGYQGFSPDWKVSVSGSSNSIASYASEGLSNLYIGRRGGFAMPLNVGFTFNSSPQSQWTIGVKIPLVRYNYKITAEDKKLADYVGASNVKLATYNVQVGYNYTF